MNQVLKLILTLSVTSLFITGCDEKPVDANSAASTQEKTTTHAPAVESSEAMLNQAKKELYGLEGTTIDYDKGFENLSKASELGDGAAMFFLGKMYETGLGRPVDLAKAVEWYQKSLATGCRAIDEASVKALKARIAKKK